MRSRLLKRLVIAIFVALTGGESYQAYIAGVPVGETINGIVVHVADGDTLRINGIKIRLWGVNAPEKDERGYFEASSILKDQVLLQTISCVIRDRDRYSRIVAQCYRGDQDIGATLIRSGWARDYVRYSKGFYLSDEHQARKEHKGLWQS